jgi:(p)ppGpp synthase/HD superfamily hydrolase
MTLSKAIAITATGFEGINDKGGTPYILHCLYVMYRIRDKFESDEEIQSVAVLHDLVEDTDWTLEDLRKEGFSERVVRGVGFLTHDPEVSYEDYIKNLGNHEDARQVKMADLRHNSKITRMKGLTKKDIERLEKYHWAYLYLSKVWEEEEAE